jgi:fumarate hydratase class II
MGVVVGMQDKVRIEHDSLGDVAVPAAHYWGAQTQRSLQHFSIGADRMPMAVVRALALVKQAAATANARLGALPEHKADAIRHVVAEILAGDLDKEFPLAVYQTGSGTQTNANVNEVIANRANELLGGALGSNTPLHPSDDVNMSQSTNDAFVTAMHVAAFTATAESLLPRLSALRDAIVAKARAWAEVPKVGRTHLMDATPLTVGQEWSGYAASLSDAIEDIARCNDGLLAVALGGTAVGTGVNAPPGYPAAAVAALAEDTGHPFRPARNAFAAQATLDPMVRAHGALKGAAVVLFKIANDLRWAASGPRAGLAELRIPANEPGSTIMPGKVNPTQAEAMLQVCLAVIGHDATVAMAGAEGNFELNAFRPVVIDTTLQSVRLLGDSADSLRRHLIEGTELNERRLRQNVADSVMVVTALSPVIGYESAARVAKTAIDDDLSIREALAQEGYDPALADDLAATALGTVDGTGQS